VFIRDERVLIAWSDLLDSIILACRNFKERLIKLLWRSRPAVGALSASSQRDSNFGSSLCHSSSGSPNVQELSRLLFGANTLRTLVREWLLAARASVDCIHLGARSLSLSGRATWSMAKYTKHQRWSPMLWRSASWPAGQGFWRPIQRDVRERALRDARSPGALGSGLQRSAASEICVSRQRLVRTLHC
jgi:hypothetical protein